MAARKGAKKGKASPSPRAKRLSAEFKRRSLAAKKGWQTRKAKAQARSAAARRGWETRKKKARSAAARKGAETRRYRGAQGRELRAARFSDALGLAHLHGRRKDDWYTLKSMVDEEDPRWLAFAELADSLGLRAAHARNEWMSPKVQG